MPYPTAGAVGPLLLVGTIVALMLAVAGFERG